MSEEAVVDAVVVPDGVKPQAPEGHQAIMLGGRWLIAKQMQAGQLMVLSMMIRSLPWEGREYSVQLGRLGDLFESLMTPEDYIWVERGILAERITIAECISAWAVPGTDEAVRPKKAAPKRIGRAQ